MKQTRIGWLTFSGVLLLGLGAVSPLPAVPGSFITTVPIVTSGLSGPIGVTNASDGSNRLFIVQQCGQIRILSGTTLLATPFLDIGSTGSNLIVCGGEQGLLGLAFHPSYETNGFFYVYYTRRDNPATTDNEGGDIVVSRFHVSANPNVADSSSELILLTIEHSSQGNHNGGHLAFGPDGNLYLGTGDGGGGGDPFENGQNINALLGKILRIDVNSDGFPADPSRNYAIPAGNPFAGPTAGADEIWDFGLRNPWHFSFDRLTGDLFIGDVGQNAFEEIDRQAAGSPGGVNYGWDCREGAHNFSDTNGDMNVNCGPVVSTDPILEYDHSLGCSVTGGFVFRNLPSHSMFGNYFFGDFCSGRLWRGVPGGGGTWTRTDVADTAFSISGFGENETGRMYFTDLAANTLQWLAPFTFADAPPTTFGWAFIEAIHEAGITSGCGGDNFCPSALVTRGEMAVFLLVAREGAGFNPPPCTSPMFNDVPCSNEFAPWVNELARRGITSGCGGGNYCPNDPVTRGEMAVFLLTTREGTGFMPPACPPSSFGDVPSSSPFCPWIKEIANRGVTAGCGGGNYCPANPVNRSQMAVFLATMFGLPVP
jgi:glucose/arabinose dehydrogenase